MHLRRRFFVGLMLAIGGCAQIVDADGSYVLQENGSSGTGPSGGAGGASVCTTIADCPSSGDPCSNSECVDGFCRQKNVLAGTPCIAGQPHVCNGQGACVECTLAEHCVNIVETQCTKRVCADNTCQTQYFGKESPASPVMQQPGDCHIVVCDGSGGTQTINDDADAPNDENGCTVDTCLNGSEVHTKVPTGTNCGVDSYCNEAGQCVGCLVPEHCAGTFDFCNVATCQSNVCGVDHPGDGTSLPSNEQSPGDCFVLVCDGAGNKVSRVDINDPPSDGNPCTRDICSAEGMASHEAEAAGTLCGDTIEEVCDGMGICKRSNGKTCGSDAECVNGHCVDGYCCENTCTSTCKACNVPGSEGLCKNVPLGLTDNNAQAVCNGVKVCDGIGTCKLANGQGCSWDNQCASGNCQSGNPKVCKP